MERMVIKAGWDIGVILVSKDKKERLVTKEVQVKLVSGGWGDMRATV